ncbi:hypothetical protein BKA93DRAFT_103497 [Sparassis latifolia]
MLQCQSYQPNCGLRKKCYSGCHGASFVLNMRQQFNHKDANPQEEHGVPGISRITTRCQDRGHDGTRRCLTSYSPFPEMLARQRTTAIRTPELLLKLLSRNIAACSPPYPPEPSVESFSVHPTLVSLTDTRILRLRLADTLSCRCRNCVEQVCRSYLALTRSSPTETTNVPRRCLRTFCI